MELIVAVVEAMDGKEAFDSNDGSVVRNGDDLGGGN